MQVQILTELLITILLDIFFMKNCVDIISCKYSVITLAKLIMSNFLINISGELINSKNVSIISSKTIDIIRSWLCVHSCGYSVLLAHFLNTAYTITLLTLRSFSEFIVECNVTIHLTDYRFDDVTRYIRKQIIALW